MKRDRNNRREKILQALAHMLEKEPGVRITTAKLAVAVGVSEAALYRHYPSKGKILEGLVEYIEESVLEQAQKVLEQDLPAMDKLGRIIHLLLEFAQKNPGACRILTGEALAGETERLRRRVGQFLQQYEALLVRLLREAEEDGLHPSLAIPVAANLLLAFVEGRIHMFVRSDFRSQPLQYWQEQWNFLMEQLLNADTELT